MTGEQQMANQKRILVVDDEREVRAFFCDVAEELGYLAEGAGDFTAFKAAYARLDPTMILLDLTMPDVDGVEFLRELATRRCGAAIVLASGQDERVLATAQRIGRMHGLTMHAVLQKPVAVPDLEAVLGSAGASGIELTAVDLERAIANGELMPFYQPKIDLQHGDTFPIVGSEALARWLHPTLGIIPPDRFVPLAEESGLIVQLTDAMLTMVVAQLGALARLGIRLPISVNLSPRQLTQLTLPDRLASMLSTAELDPSLLVVEITEQAAMSDITKATEIVTRLRLKNISVSLDDFGSGYSSLVELYRLPLSELKFDRSLISDADNNPDARVVFRALAALARELKIPVCVEGIESARSAAFAQSLGCEAAQGYFFAKPMPADDFRDFLERGSAGPPVMFARESASCAVSG